MPTMPRPMRIPDDVWFPALARVRSWGTTLTGVVTEFLRVVGAMPDDVLTPARERAKRDGTTLTAVVVLALHEYGSAPSATTPKDETP